MDSESREALYRKSGQRDAVLGAVRAMGGHSTADDVYRLVRATHPRISLGTVYRNLRVLCDQGEIREVKSGADFSRFEVAGPGHYHLICRNCGRIEDCLMPVDASLEDRVRPTTGFKVEQHRLEFIGLCPDCLAPGSARFQSAKD